VKTQAEIYTDEFNVIWTSQSKDASGSMPLGGGDVGCNVWVEDNQLLLYFQRSGVHDEFNGFPKLGRIRLWTEPNVFDCAESFQQTLNLRESCIEIEAIHETRGSIRIAIWVEVHRPIIHIDVTQSSGHSVFTQYESWRTEPRALDPASNLGERWGWWGVEGWPHKAILEPDRFIPESDRFVFYHVNPTEKLSSKLAYETIGLGEYYGRFYDPLKDLIWGGGVYGNGWEFDGVYRGRYACTDYTGWRYRNGRPGTEHNISIVMHTSRTGSCDAWLSEINEACIEAKTGVRRAWAQNQKWWMNFWNRSWVVVGARVDDYRAWTAGRNYNLFRYMTACNAYGENPTMFNGGLFTFDPELAVKEITESPVYRFHPDWRRWGGGNYTLQNQRWVYWPMLKWGDTAHMTPQFDFFSRTLAVAELRVRHHFEHDGCKYPEPCTVYGLPMPPHYGFQKSYLPNRQRLRWMEDGVSRSNAISMHHTAMLEFSHMILEYFRYSRGDIESWLPFIKSTLDFYDQHFRMRTMLATNQEYDRDGKLVLYPTSVCETYKHAVNGVPDIAGLQAVVEGVLQLPTSILDTYFNGRDHLAELSKRIPELTYTKVDGDTVLPPARSFAHHHYDSCELYPSYPMFPFDRITIGDDEMEYIYNTHKHWRTWQTQDAWEEDWAWTYANVAYARMGWTEKAAELTLRKLCNGRYRFPAFFGPEVDWAPDHNQGGAGSVGLQEMLMQTPGRAIRLFPAWPRNWDVDFKFHAPYQTVVEVRLEAGRIEKLSVAPTERAADVILPDGWC
jgi:hypothetical protein